MGVYTIKAIIGYIYLSVPICPYQQTTLNNPNFKHAVDVSFLYVIMIQNICMV